MLHIPCSGFPLEYVVVHGYGNDAEADGWSYGNISEPLQENEAVDLMSDEIRRRDQTIIRSEAWNLLDGPGRPAAAHEVDVPGTAAAVHTADPPFFDVLPPLEAAVELPEAIDELHQQWFVEHVTLCSGRTVCLFDGAMGGFYIIYGGVGSSGTTHLGMLEYEQLCERLGRAPPTPVSLGTTKSCEQILYLNF